MKINSVFCVTGLLLLLTAACDVSMMPPTAATPTAATPTAATSTVVLEATATPSAGVGLQSQRYGYIIPLAPSWQLLYWSERTGSPVPTELSAGVEQAQALFAVDNIVTEFVDLVAQKEGNGAEVGVELILSVVPRDGLSIQDYLAAVAQDLTATEGVENLSTGFDDTLRNDKLPTGVLSFNREGIAHQQLSLFNQETSAIILLSFAAPVDQQDAMDLAIAEIMRAFSIQ